MITKFVIEQDKVKQKITPHAMHLILYDLQISMFKAFYCFFQGKQFFILHNNRDIPAIK